jgi:hypothetical protein
LPRRFVAVLLALGVVKICCGQEFPGTYRLEGEVSPIEFSVTQAGEGYALSWRVDGIRFAGKGLAQGGILAGILMEEEEGGTALLNVVFKTEGEVRSGGASGGGEEGLSGYSFVEYSLEANPIGTQDAGAFALADCDLEGSYSVTGTYPGDTVSYTGTLDLKRTSGTWEAAWRIADAERAGTGVVVNDLLIAGFDTGEGAGLAMYRIAGDTLSGVWFGSPDWELSNGQPIVTGREECVRKKVIED